MNKKFLPLILLGLGCNSTPMHVDIGTLEYSKGREIMSDNFYVCSALILDSGKNVTLAHALPYNVEFVSSKRYMIEAIDSENAVEESLERFKEEEKGNIEAILIGGEEKGFAKILKDLKKRGVKIRLAYVAAGPGPRTVSYNPKTDELNVNPTGEK